MLASSYPAALLAGVICLFAADSTWAGSFKIASRGQAKTEIVVETQEPQSPIAFAAQELQRYVKEMSGAELPIVNAPSGRSAIVLRALQNKQASDDPSEKDHYRLTVDSKKLQIDGASPRAVLYGVYDVLERLGCGWCVPGDDTVPKRQTLELAALQVDARPAFQYRMMLLWS
jgi:hypothetical protein